MVPWALSGDRREGAESGGNGRRESFWERRFLPWRSSPIFSYLSYLILSYPILSCPILSYPILSYLVLSCPILSYLLLSSPIFSYLVIASNVLKGILIEIRFDPIFSHYDPLSNTIQLYKDCLIHLEEEG